MKWLNKLPLIIAILLLVYGFLNGKNPRAKSNPIAPWDWRKNHR